MNLNRNNEDQVTGALASKESQVFLPNKEPASLFKRWCIFLIFFLVMSIFIVLTARSRKVFLMMEAGWVFFMICLVVRDKAPVSVKISAVTKTLEYSYLNSFGKRKSAVVDLTHPGGEYRYDVSRAGSAWKLVLFNDNMFKNRVSLRAAKNGFDKAQLDQMVLWIRQCKI